MYKSKCFEGVVYAGYPVVNKHFLLTVDDPNRPRNLWTNIEWLVRAERALHLFDPLTDAVLDAHLGDTIPTVYVWDSNLQGFLKDDDGQWVRRPIEVSATTGYSWEAEGEWKYKVYREGGPLYHVDLREDTCTCKNTRLVGCKHRDAMWLVAREVK